MESMKRPTESKKGFSLFEVLVAAAIFAFAMAGILPVFIKCGLLDQTNRNKGISATHAEAIMEDIMEYMRNHETSDLQLNLATWNLNTVAAIGSQLGCTLPYVYPCVLDNESITTTYSDADPVNHPPLITVTVQWNNKLQTNARTLTLRTYTSKRG